MSERVEYFNPDTLAKPLGLYSQASRDAETGLVFLAGQVALGSDGVLVGVGDFAAQAKQAFANVDAALTAAGANWTTVLKLTTYLTRLGDCATFGTLRRAIFDTLVPSGGLFPPHTLLVVSGLSAPEHLIEVEAIAARARGEAIYERSQIPMRTDEAGRVSADIGHVHLKVAELERSVRFYRLLGFEIRNEINGAVFLAFDSYHHHVALNTWKRSGGDPPAATSTGLDHFAVRYRSRRDLGRVVRLILDAGISLESTSDCGGIADSVYIRDPDQNGVELTWDRPREQRPSPLPATDRPLDLDDLCAEGESDG